MKILTILGVVVTAIVTCVIMAAVFSWFVMYLWNHCLVVAVDGIHPITWKHAFGIAVLCGLLFKSNASISK